MPRQERSRFLKKSNIADEVEALLRPVIEELGYGIWDVVYRKVGADWVLTVTIDHPQGISIDDWEQVHRRIDPILDEADPIDNPYMLEVSSPRHRARNPHRCAYSCLPRCRNRGAPLCPPFRKTCVYRQASCLLRRYAHACLR